MRKQLPPMRKQQLPPSFLRSTGGDVGKGAGAGQLDVRSSDDAQSWCPEIPDHCRPPAGGTTTYAHYRPTRLHTLRTLASLAHCHAVAINLVMPAGKDLPV